MGLVGWVLGVGRGWGGYMRADTLRGAMRWWGRGSAGWVVCVYGGWSGAVFFGFPSRSSSVGVVAAGWGFIRDTLMYLSVSVSVSVLSLSLSVYIYIPSVKQRGLHVRRSICISLSLSLYIYICVCVPSVEQR